MKREQLVKLRDQLEADLRAVTCDIDHLEAAIRLFDPETTPDAVRRYTTRHRAKKGTGAPLRAVGAQGRLRADHDEDAHRALACRAWP
jgi:hypothetical protein